MSMTKRQRRWFLWSLTIIAGVDFIIALAGAPLHRFTLLWLSAMMVYVCVGDIISEGKPAP